MVTGTLDGLVPSLEIVGAAQNNDTESVDVRIPREERADAKAREKYKGDKAFVQDALRAMPEEEVAEMLNMVPIPDKVKKVKSIGEEFDDIMKMASKVVDSLEKLKREGKIEQLDLKRFSITLRILADCLDEFAKLSEGV